MKYLYLLIILISPFFSHATALDSLNVVHEQTVKYEGQSYSALVVTVEASPDFLKETWKDFVKDKHDVRLKGFGFLTNKDVLSAEEEQFEGLSTKRADMYTRFVPQKNSTTRIELFMSLGYDVNVSNDSYEGIFESLKASFTEYLNVAIPSYYKKQVKRLAGDLKDLRKELKRATEKGNDYSSDRTSNIKDIEDNRSEIAKLEKENEELTEQLKENQEKRNALEKQIAILQKRADEKRARLNGLEIK